MATAEIDTYRLRQALWFASDQQPGSPPNHLATAAWSLRSQRAAHRLSIETEIEFPEEWSGTRPPKLRRSLRHLPVRAHLAPAGHEVPDLLDGPVLDSPRGVPGRELEMGHAASIKPEQYANIGPVGSHTGALHR